MHALLDDLRAGLVLQCQQRDRGSLDMGRKRNTVDNAVPGIPASAYARTVKKHVYSQPDSVLECLRTVADRELLDGDDAERRRNHPTTCAWTPRPSIFVWIESNLAIRCFEFPSPEPIAFFASRCEEPMQCSLTHVRGVVYSYQRGHGQRRCPRRLRVTFECRPSTVRALRFH